ncbi:hypothetical protein ACFQ1E_13985 [Sphingomonas canadensis]|uniref:Uncharacterized protein n=1 Tax=Sphingomonas canadensis TaxID=1219257 RepID=A0ABW3H7H4_9SPHN|nr:hypothetical protein [Sphingomonas canadensis]MCW3837306.1 hypothetical protein [Sphingomonas canadensis]
MLFAAPASAGVVDGVRTVGDITVYLGAVPASIVRGHVADHPEARMHGGVPGPGSHAVHLVVAVFQTAGGRRVTDAAVVARISEDRGASWTIPLAPMTINGALTYGGYANLRGVNDYHIDIVVTRPQKTQEPYRARRANPLTARFTYSHD